YLSLSDNFFFFFSSRRRHTRWPRDWSSDVCSSDLKSFMNTPTFSSSFYVRKLPLASSMLWGSMSIASAAREFSDAPGCKRLPTAGVEETEKDGGIGQQENER